MPAWIRNVLIAAGALMIVMVIGAVVFNLTN